MYSLRDSLIIFRGSSAPLPLKLGGLEPPPPPPRPRGSYDHVWGEFGTKQKVPSQVSAHNAIVDELGTSLLLHLGKANTVFFCTSKRQDAFPTSSKIHHAYMLQLVISLPWLFKSVYETKILLHFVKELLKL